MSTIDPGPDAIVDAVLNASSAVLVRRRGRRLGPANGLAARTMGTLTAAKLHTRLVGRALSPELRPELERFSDDVAAAYFAPIASSVDSYEIPGVAGTRLSPRLVANHADHTGARWSAVTISDDEASPFPTGLLDPPVPEVADRITSHILDMLATLRADVRTKAGDDDRQEGQFHLISETVALAACAKLFLALWGGGRLAAGFEALADRCAAHEITPR